MIPQDYESGLRPERARRPTTTPTTSAAVMRRTAPTRRCRVVGADVAERYANAVAAYVDGMTFDAAWNVARWGVAVYGSDLPFGDMEEPDPIDVDDILAQVALDVADTLDGCQSKRRERVCNLRRATYAAIRREIDYWHGRTARSAYRPKPAHGAKPNPSRAVEDCIEAGRRAACISSVALMALSPVDVRHMDTAEERRAQLAAMFDCPGIRSLPVGIMPHSGAWIPRAGLDFMPVADWLSDGARLATAGELVKINPFTGASEDRADGKTHLATNATVAAFAHALMEFDELPLADQCAFWHGALTLYRLPVVALVYSGGKSIHGVVRVDCADRAEFDRATAILRRKFATSPNPSMRLDVQSLALPIAGARLAGCIRADTGRAQRLLFLHDSYTHSAQSTHKPADAQTGNHAPEAVERATEPFLGVLCDSAPMPPTMPQGNEDFDELLAAFEVLDAWSADG